MRVLAVTNMWPSRARPASGALVEQQVEGLRRAGLDIRVLHVDRLGQGMRAYAGLGERCAAAANAKKADVVHVMYGGIMAAQVAGAIRSCPTVVSFCGSDLFGEPLAPAGRRLLAWMGVLASQRAARHASGIVVKSRALQDALPPAVQSKVRVIPNGVDLDKFQPQDPMLCKIALGWNPRRLHILFPKTNAAAVKRPALARAAAQHLARLGVDVELHDLAGVAHKDVPVWINGCDVLLVTSAHEGSPNVVKEALACEVPIVSVDVGDVGERIAGVNGCHLAAPNAADLSRKIQLVMLGPRRVDGRPHLRELALERISEMFLDLYTDLARQWESARSAAQGGASVKRFWANQR